MLKEKLAAQFEFLKAKAPPLVGCDISSSSVKMVEIAEAGRNVYRVERYAIEPLPKDTVVDGTTGALVPPRRPEHPIWEPSPTPDMPSAMRQSGSSWIAFRGGQAMRS